MLKVIQECSGFALFRYMIGPATRATSLTNQIQTKTNRDLVTCVLPCFRRFASFHFEFSWAPCDIFLAIIGCCGCFGFGYDTQSKSFLRVSVSFQYENFVSDGFYSWGGISEDSIPRERGGV